MKSQSAEIVAGGDEHLSRFVFMSNFCQGAAFVKITELFRQSG